MSTVELRKLAKHGIDRLSPDRLRSAVDYIGFLSVLPEGDVAATARPSFAARIARARRDAAGGKLVSAAQLRRKY